jgi:hypothetical protein
MGRFRQTAIIVTFAMTPLAITAAKSATEPLAYFIPGLHLNAGDRRNLEAGDTIVKVLPGRGRELGVVAAVRTHATAESLVAWGRRAGMMRQSRYVPVTVRFSSPPRFEDLDAVSLDEAEYADIANCEPSDCGLKLSRGEMALLQRHIGRTNSWKEEVEEEFRRTLFQRAVEYLAKGNAGLTPYEDGSTPVSADLELASLIDRLGLNSPQLSGVADYLRLYPSVEHPNVVDSFLYWSKETLGFKPITSITHPTLLHSDALEAPATIAISKQVYASHYKDSALSVTAIVRSGAVKYLVSAHRSHVDVLDGVFGGVARRIIERRIRSEAPTILNGLRVRLETGDPPQ